MKLSVRATISVLFLFYAIGIFFFGKGFLLNRPVLEKKAISQYDQPFKPRFRKLIFVVIDALRYDFIDSEKNDGIPYHGVWSMKHLNESLLFHALADAPTTTGQRLKAIAGGSLPTFTEAASNFASTNLKEDTFVYQLSLVFDKIFFMGDDTWVKLFPDILGEKNRSFPFESFKLFDLHTVDNGVKEHLFPTLEKGDFDVIIAHFLGVDHCGHKYGPLHSSMPEKLNEMSLVIDRICETIDDETLLVVLGDHGMTETGDHGGDSSKELSTALLFYAKISLKSDEYFASLFKKMRKEREKIIFGSNQNTIPQIDVTSTISYLFSLPFPYSNVGFVIPDLLMTQGSRKKVLLHICSVLEANLRQLLNYIQDMSHFQSMSRMKNDYFLRKKQFQIQDTSIEALESLALFYVREASHILVELESIWTEFDVSLIMMGLTILFLSWLLHLLSIRETIFMTAPSPFLVVTVCVLTWMFVFDSVNYVYQAIFSTAIVWIMTLLAEHHPLDTSNVDWFCFLLMAVYSCTFGSNSFIIFEDSTTRFLLSSVIIYISRDNLVSMFQSLFVVRLFQFFGACREEQYPYCHYVNSLGPIAMALGVVPFLYSFSRTFKKYFWVLVVPLCYSWVYRMLQMQHNVIADVWVPQILYAATFVMSFLQPIEALLFFISIVQRPIGGWLLLTNSIFVRKQSTFFLFFWSLCAFFSTEHQAVVASIQWESAFFGFTELYYLVAVILVLANSIGPFLYSAVVTKHTRLFLFCLVCPAMVQCAANAFLRQHLMIWKIFVPRWILQWIIILVCFVVAILKK